MRTLVLAFILGTLALALAAAAAAADRYCSPTGDFCTSTQRISGAVYLRLSTFSFSGPVKVCVTEPGGSVNAGRSGSGAAAPPGS